MEEEKGEEKSSKAAGKKRRKMKTEKTGLATWEREFRKIITPLRIVDCNWFILNEKKGAKEQRIEKGSKSMVVGFFSRRGFKTSQKPVWESGRLRSKAKILLIGSSARGGFLIGWEKKKGMKERGGPRFDVLFMDLFVLNGLKFVSNMLKCKT